MVQLIDVPEDARKQAIGISGWRVTVSQSVWERCVTVPKGVEGQTEGGRLHDLLAFLGYHLRQAVVPRHVGISAGFGFCVNVVNDNHKRCDHAEGLEVPGVPVPLAAGALALDSTWYDIQDMGSLGPRIVVGADGRVHVTWQDDFCEFDANGCPPNLNLPQPHPLRGMGYAWRDAASAWHHLGKVEDPAIRVCPCVSEVFGGFGAIAVAADGRAVVASHPQPPAWASESIGLLK